MLRYDPGPLPAAAAAALRRLQATVDAEPDHAARIAAAGRLFGRKTPRSAFQAVRERLARVSPPGEACYYCERDRYRDIEHVRPKRHYPERCFDWSNYVYACVICNQDRKGDRFAVILDDGTLRAFDRSLPAGAPPPAGIPALIDLRAEDPFRLLTLDLATGRFIVTATDAADRLRAAFTRDLFDLNNDALARIRRQTLDHALAYARRHAAAVAAGDAGTAARIVAELRALPHPTVLHELRRQRDGTHLAAVAADLAALPGALWDR
jgi:uncharacterized protein (TIGR02646 family)